MECAMDHYKKESLCFEIEDHFIIQVPGTNQFIVLDQTTRELHYIDYVDKKKLDTLASIRSKLRKEKVLPIIKELSDEDPESDTIEDNLKTASTEIQCDPAIESFDVLINGAGPSGLLLACLLHDKLQTKTERKKLPF